MDKWWINSRVLKTYPHSERPEKNFRAYAHLSTQTYPYRWIAGKESGLSSIAEFPHQGFDVAAKFVIGAEFILYQFLGINDRGVVFAFIIFGDLFE